MEALLDIKRKLALFFHKLSLAWLSCMIFMVQGNLMQLTSKHAIIATRTGVITGALVVLMSFILPIFMFIGCFIADLLSHPTHFGHFWTEAFCTALLAASFSYVITLSPAGKKLEEYLGGK